MADKCCKYVDNRGPPVITVWPVAVIWGPVNIEYGLLSQLHITYHRGLLKPADMTGHHSMVSCH